MLSTERPPPEPPTLEYVNTRLAKLHARVQRLKVLGGIRTALRDSTPPTFHPLFTSARYKGCYGGRGSAKSWSFATMVLERCFAQDGARIVCVREVQHSLEQSVKRLLEDLIKSHDLTDRFRILNTHIETPGDGIIIFRGMNGTTAESIKSLEAFDIAWVEEAQTLSQDSLDLLRPTIRQAGSELWFSWNPQQPTDPVDALLRSPVQLPDSLVLEANYTDNPHLPEVLQREIEWDRKRDPDKYLHIWKGAYRRNTEAQVFKNWRVEEFTTPDTATFLFGGDFGFSIDPTVLVRAFIDGTTLYIDHECYEVGCEIDDTPALYDGLICGCNYHRADPCRRPETHGMARRWEIIADSARPESISYLQRHGYGRVKAAKKGPGSIEEGITFLKMYSIVVHPRCTHTIDELSLYSYKKHPLTGQIMPILEDKKNHVIDSLRYAVELVRNPMPDFVTW